MTMWVVSIGLVLVAASLARGFGNRWASTSAVVRGRGLAGPMMMTASSSPEKTSDVVAGAARSGEMLFPDDISEEWELDCYSRPVILEDGKKLWEVLITDANGSFRYLKTVPNNLVNSRNLRKIIEEVIEESPVRPTSIRFFRNQMLNMITIALNSLDVEVKPSRRVYNLYQWLSERERDVYPSFDGYNPQLKQQTILDYDIRQPDRLPDVCKAESYAFVALPAEAFHGGEVNKDNIQRGRLCPIGEMPKEGWIHGITLFSRRAEAVAAWMNGLEMAHLQANLLSRELMLNTDISTQYIVAPLMDAQRREAQIFEKGKTSCGGYHFISVQESPESEDVQGFWLLREFDTLLGEVKIGVESMGCTGSQEVFEAPPHEPLYVDVGAAAPLAPAPVLNHDIHDMSPSSCGLLGLFKIKLNGQGSVGDAVVPLEINDEYVRYKDCTIPIDSCEREILDEGVPGTRTLFMRIVAYVPDTQWSNGDPLLEKIELCARCEYDPAVGHFVNTADIINVIFQRDAGEPNNDAIATRNGYSDKAKRLAKSQSFKGNVFNASFTETECLVCFEDFDEEKHMPMAAPCGHMWCSSCIVAVLAFAPPANCGTCPTCRRAVKLGDVKRVRLSTTSKKCRNSV